MNIKDVPRWLSCPKADSYSAVWSMVANEMEAVRAIVLAMSIKVSSVFIAKVNLSTLILNDTFKATWYDTQPMPDLRLLIMEPSTLTGSTLTRLTQYGWGLCHVPMPDYLKWNTRESDKL